ncbi:phosphoribulokinase/uridine kinase family protein [Coprobacillus sp. CAG:698]|nr:phosphoribulokinase/uridine kinase family protein [Coprobacillus sp. CAG:698]
MFIIKINNQNYSFEDKIVLKDLAKDFMPNAIVAKVNNRLRELNYYINYNCEVEFLDLTKFDAVRVYETSLRYLLIMALEKIDPKIVVHFNQCISRSISCTLSNTKEKVSKPFIDKLEIEMRKLIEQDLPITRTTISKEEAIKIYTEKGYLDKVEVLKYRPEDTVNMYTCCGYVNYMFGYMVPSTGLLKDFVLQVYYPGFIVRIPRAECGGKIPPFEEAPVFQQMIQDAQKWAKMIKCVNLPMLNKYVDDGKVCDLVNICETKHNNMLSELGEQIYKRRDSLRLVCIAGPSSSGKTTFSHRLKIELLSRGLKPIKISMDDYYRNREDCPKDEKGDYDLEHVNALDLELFNENLLSLIEGEEIEEPTFDFKLGKRVKGEKVRIDKDTIIIIEGIHALNEEVTKLIPKPQKYKIFISPFSQLNIDNHNPIPASEIRLLRRIVRDAKYRKTDPSETFAMWPSVRRGEFKWIYPCQEEADYVFNTELTYELCVMKKYALSALSVIDRDNEYYVQANRILKFLKYVKDIDEKYVPCNSLLREFIGDSCFYNFDE